MSARHPHFETLAGAPIGTHLVRPDTRIIDADGWYRLVTPSCRKASANEVLRARIAAGRVDAEVDRVLGEYATLGVRHNWVAGPDSDAPGLERALDARGLEPWQAWATARAVISRRDYLIAMGPAERARRGAPNRRALERSEARR